MRKLSLWNRPFVEEISDIYEKKGLLIDEIFYDLWIQPIKIKIQGSIQTKPFILCNLNTHACFKVWWSMVEKKELPEMINCSNIETSIKSTELRNAVIKVMQTIREEIGKKIRNEYEQLYGRQIHLILIKNSPVTNEEKKNQLQNEIKNLEIEMLVSYNLNKQEAIKMANTRVWD